MDTSSKRLLIFILGLILAYMITNITFIENNERIKAKLYTNINTDETREFHSGYLPDYYGIYTFTVDNETFIYRSSMPYELKMFLPKTITIIYNSKNPSEFRAVAKFYELFILVTGLSFGLFSVIDALKVNTTNKNKK